MAKFKLATRPRYWWQVVTHTPSAKKVGTTEKMTFQLEFEPMPNDESKRFSDAQPKDRADGSVQNDIDFLVAVTKDWGDIVDENEQPVPFSEEAYRQALQYPFFRLPIVTAYWNSQSGEEARLGN